MRTLQISTSLERSSSASQQVWDVYCLGLPIRSCTALALMFQHPRTSAPWLVNEVHCSILSGGSDWLSTYTAIRAWWPFHRRHVSALVMLTDTWAYMMSPTGGNKCSREWWSSLHPMYSSVRMLKISSLSLNEQLIVTGLEMSVGKLAAFGIQIYVKYNKLGWSQLWSCHHGSKEPTAKEPQTTWRWYVPMA